MGRQTIAFNLPLHILALDDLCGLPEIRREDRLRF